LCACIYLLMGSCVIAWTQPAAVKAPPASGNSISASTPAYTLEWDGVQGTLTRKAMGREPEKQIPLFYLHADPGPKGHARYLAWFLARETDGFTILWCYLNETGRDFWVWLYRFPANQLTTLRFSGSYRFQPLTERPAVPPIESYALKPTLRYNGPDFTFRDWTRRAGTLDSLPLRPVAMQPVTGPQPETAPARTLTNLSVTPLHEIRVAPGNGWRSEGWRELHALAYDAAQDPYYLILYSNSPNGFAIDLKRAQTFVTNFGAPIQFASDASAFGRKDDPITELPDPGVRRYDRHEIVLNTTEKYTNPYTQVLLDVDLRGPDGKRYVLPGFWDGGDVWRVRFTPTRIGIWRWRTRSNDPELHNQQGQFECIPDEGASKGFVRVHPSRTYRRHFAFSDDTPFLPVFASRSAVAFPARPDSEKISPEEQFKAFEAQIKALAAQGFNRLVGGYLFDTPQRAESGPMPWRNEGGPPIVQGDFDQLNPVFFQWLDRRLASCNEKGLIPDLGLGDLWELSEVSDVQLRRLWRYMLARYASFNVCWNLFRSPTWNLEKAKDKQLPAGWEMRVSDLAGITRLYDPYRHPQTTLITPPLGPLPVAPMPAPTPAPTPGVQVARAQESPPLRRRKIAPLPPPLSPMAEEDWMDVIALDNPLLDWIERDWRADKPITLYDDSARAGTPDALRARLWATRMRGGYYALQTRAEAESETLLKEMQYMAQFFRQTRFWRLEPRPDMLGGIEESPITRRRRKRAEAEARAAAGLPPETAKPNEAPKAPEGPIYVLADSAWEYVVYFSRGGMATLDLVEATGDLKMVWFNPRTGEFVEPQTISGGTYRAFTAPDTSDWVLHITRRGR
jgi:hypothetical protein